MKKHYGFTLIEAVVTISVFTILTALLAPVLFRGIAAAKLVKKKAWQRDVAIGRYADTCNIANYNQPQPPADAPNLRIERNFWP